MKFISKIRTPRVVAAVTAASILIALAPASQAQSGASQFRIGVEGQVPVICRVSVDAVQVDPSDGTAALGNLKEFCNNARGYQVVADYAPALAGSSLVVDGVEIPLTESGSVTVSRSATAASASRKLALKLASNSQPGNLTFRITPQ